MLACKSTYLIGQQNANLETRCKIFTRNAIIKGMYLVGQKYVKTCKRKLWMVPK